MKVCVSTRNEYVAIDKLTKKLPKQPEIQGPRERSRPLAPTLEERRDHHIERRGHNRRKRTEQCHWISALGQSHDQSEPDRRLDSKPSSTNTTMLT